MKIVELYETIDGNFMPHELVGKLAFVRAKYLKFSEEHLKDMLVDMSHLKRAIGTKIDHECVVLRFCSLEWWLNRMYRIFRYFFVSWYFYLMPFLTMVFNSVLLYANEYRMRQMIEQENALQEQAINS